MLLDLRLLYQFSAESIETTGDSDDGSSEVRTPRRRRRVFQRPRGLPLPIAAALALDEDELIALGSAL